MSSDSPEQKQFGRYTLLKPLGSGAMGVVYAAYDPQLDRQVALKLVQGADAKLRASLSREAQTMARLQHPNVVTVHDVGVERDQLFVAMDLVRGGTLADWLRASRRSWREVLPMFLHAARGLAAAHAAGIVHRDFKPENVLVGDDGRVRVSDFGLSRTASSNSSSHLESKSPGNRESNIQGNSDKQAVTPASVATAPAGTPAYAAPEQARGERVDARADVFSFCVALYEGLYGERPFAGGADLAQLAAAIEAGEIREPPPGARVPAWLRREVLSGLKANREERPASMEELLTRLSRRSHPLSLTRRRWWIAAAVLVVVSGAALWSVRRSSRAAICAGAPAKLAGVWDPPLRESTHQRFIESKKPYAEASWQIASSLLDGYAADWTAMRTEACEATALRHAQSSELLDLRMACLDDRLRELSRTAAIFATADEEVIQSAATAARKLTPLAGCANEAALREPNAPPPAQLAEVNAIREKLAELTALDRAGKGLKQIDSAHALVAAARKLGYAPLLAEVLLESGGAESQGTDPRVARPTWEEAAALGLSARVDQVVAYAWLDLVKLNLQISQSDAAERAAIQAQAAVSRLGDDHRAKAQLELDLAYLNRADERTEVAQHHAERAVAEAEVDNAPSLPWALSELGQTLSLQAKWVPAQQAYERAMAVAAAQLGPLDRVVAEMESGLGALFRAQDRMTEARGHQEHALSLLEQAFGPDHYRLVDPLLDLGATLVEIDPAASVRYATRARSISEQRLGAETDQAAHAQFLLGAALHTLGRLDEARKSFERARAILVKINGEESYDVAETGIGLGALFIDMGELAAARPLLEAGLKTQIRVDGLHVPAVAETQQILGRLELREHHRAKARQLFTDALETQRAVYSADSPMVKMGEELLASTNPPKSSSK